MKEEYIKIYAIVPSYIYKTKELTSEEKLIAERITALCKKEGYSWVSNKILADMYGIKEDTVSKHIKSLKEIGFIKCEYSKDINGKSRRTIHLTDDVWAKETVIDSINNQKENGYISGHNNKYNNKKNNNINNTSGPIIGVDPDGVETWNGKRIESVAWDFNNPDDVKKYNEIVEDLKQFGGNDNE